MRKAAEPDNHEQAEFDTVCTLATGHECAVDHPRTRVECFQATPIRLGRTISTISNPLCARSWPRWPRGAAPSSHVSAFFTVPRLPPSIFRDDSCAQAGVASGPSDHRSHSESQRRASPSADSRVAVAGKSTIALPVGIHEQRQYSGSMTSM